MENLTPLTHTQKIIWILVTIFIVIFTINSIDSKSSSKDMSQNTHNTNGTSTIIDNIYGKTDPKTNQTDSEEIQSVRNLVLDFGKTLKESTLSSNPDHIDISNIEITSASSYRVVGNIIERNNDQRPISIDIAWNIENKKWEIIYYNIQPDIIGTQTCLPHKDTSGPQTMECAIGIKTDTGEYYAMDLSALSIEQSMAIQSAERISLRGTIVPIESLSSSYWQKYNTKGIIRVSYAYILK